MIKLASLATAMVLLAAAPAHAEKWFYYPVPGGAMGYDGDSRMADVASGRAMGDTLVFFSVPHAAGSESFNIMIQRLEFECAGARFKVLGTAYFDSEGAALGQADPEDWQPLKAGTPPAVFKRIICNGEKPPTAKEVADRDKLVAALKALPPTTALKAAGQ